jgi:hypothetical protein
MAMNQKRFRRQHVRPKARYQRPAKSVVPHEQKSATSATV